MSVYARWHRVCMRCDKSKYYELNKNKDMQKGNIGVTTENIFPIIKKFLYSDH